MGTERPVDMSRPVPAAPSPGSSAKRAKLSEADRKRINAKTTAKDERPKPERLGIRYRFTRGDVEYAVLADGHPWVFRAGELEPGALVRSRGGYFDGRTGHVQQIVPTWGGAFRVAVRWERLPGDRKKPLAFMAREELVVER